MCHKHNIHASLLCTDGWLVSHCTRIYLKMCRYNSWFLGHLFVLCFFVHWKNVMQLLIQQIKMSLLKITHLYVWLIPEIMHCKLFSFFIPSEPKQNRITWHMYSIKILLNKLQLRFSKISMV